MLKRGLWLTFAFGLLAGHLAYRVISDADAARNASGTYSLPTGNPLVAGTAITAANHNAFRSDVSSEITDSLSRSGKGAMLAPLELANGTVSVPALSFDSDTDCGLYRIGANNVGVGVNGAKVLDVATTGLGVTGTLSATGVASLANGAVGTPALNFTSDTDTGVYRIGADNLGVAVAGAKVLDVSSTGLAVTGAVTSTTGEMVKARACVTLNGSTGAQTIDSSFNIASATVATVATFGELTITLTTAFGSAAGHVPSIMVTNGGGLLPLIMSKTSSTIVARIYNPGAAAYVVTGSLTGVAVCYSAVGS